MFALLFVVLATYRKVYYDLIENLCFILLSSATTFCFFHCSNVLGFKVHSGEVWQCGDLLWRGFRWDRSGLHLFPYGTFLEISHDDPINAPWCFSNTILVLVWGVPLGQAKVKFSKGFLAFFFSFLIAMQRECALALKNTACPLCTLCKGDRMM